MKFPYSMLLDFIQTSLSVEEAGDLLTMAGFEVEGIDTVDGEGVLDIKVMSNRGDGLSIFGLAREVLAKRPDARATALYEAAAHRFSEIQGDGAEDVSVPVRIETSDCVRYACRVYSAIPGTSTPAWIQGRLTKAGMRPISLLVDLTNYVMLELGQPLHAFDLGRLRGGCILVRRAAPGERIQTLDGQERDLTPEMMVIADMDRPVALAGIMGGADTEISDATETVLLESASFVSSSIRRTRRALGISTEASYRFERSVDPDGVVAAIRRFSQLLEAALGGVPNQSAIVDVFPNPPAPRLVSLRHKRAESLLGMTIDETSASQYLSSLGFKVSRTDRGDYMATVPSWRPDVVREEDLIEELGRVHGFDRIPEKLPVGATTLGGARGFESWKDALRGMVLRLGFSQVISHTLRDASPLDDPHIVKAGPRGVQDPEMMWLRNSVLSSLADASRRNGGRDLHLFEMGQVFGRLASGFHEGTSLGLVSQGALQKTWWNSKAQMESSFFTMKGMIEELAEFAGLELEYRLPAEHDPRLHPTRQAHLMTGGAVVGTMGQIDADTAEKAGIPGDTVLAELSLNSCYLAVSQERKVRPISRNPAVRRDVAFLIGKEIPYERIQQSITAAGGPLLERHWLFDIYEGKGMREGEHSLAVALQLRKLGGNLTDEEANRVRANVAQALESLGATMR